MAQRKSDGTFLIYPTLRLNGDTPEDAVRQYLASKPWGWELIEVVDTGPIRTPDVTLVIAKVRKGGD